MCPYRYAGVRGTLCNLSSGVCIPVSLIKPGVSINIPVLSARRLVRFAPGGGMEPRPSALPVVARVPCLPSNLTRVKRRRMYMSVRLRALGMQRTVPFPGFLSRGCNLSTDWVHHSRTKEATGQSSPAVNEQS